MLRRALVVLGFALLLGAAGATGRFVLTSPDLGPAHRFQRAQVLGRCGGGNRSPALRWHGAPPGTRGFALTLFDRDARGGAGWWHWVVLDLPAGTRGLASGAGTPASHRLPAGARQGRTSFGHAFYGGPCPPPGPAHHYVLTLYALRVARLPAPLPQDPAAIAAVLRREALATTTVIATYARRGKAP